MIITLSSIPTELEMTFLQKTMNKNDCILVSSHSISLAFKPSLPFTQCLVRKTDLNKVGGKCHYSWTVISDEQWVDLIMKSDKTITW